LLKCGFGLGDDLVWHLVVCIRHPLLSTGATTISHALPRASVCLSRWPVFYRIRL
jgi:hypothetical protein